MYNEENFLIKKFFAARKKGEDEKALFFATNFLISPLIGVIFLFFNYLAFENNLPLQILYILVPLTLLNLFTIRMWGIWVDDSPLPILSALKLGRKISYTYSGLSSFTLAASAIFISTLEPSASINNSIVSLLLIFNFYTVLPGLAGFILEPIIAKHESF